MLARLSGLLDASLAVSICCDLFSTISFRAISASCKRNLHMKRKVFNGAELMVCLLLTFYRTRLHCQYFFFFLHRVY